MKLSFLRLGDWFIKHASLVVAILMLMLSAGRLYAAELLATIIFSVAAFGYTFGLNYYLERDLDARVGKNRVAGVTPAFATAVLVLLAGVMMAVPLVMHSRGAAAIAAAYLVAATIYSARPIYLKARGAAGVLWQAVFLTAPQLIFFVVLSGIREPVITPYLAMWLFLLTAKGAVIHQIIDLDNDDAVGLATFAVRYGRTTTVTVTQILVGLLFLHAIVAFACFPWPMSAVVFMIVAFANPAYRRDRHR